MSTPVSPTQPRKRTTRSCKVCRQRKTRCEFPDPDNIPTSDDPLPRAMACHRCRVLQQPCIVRSDEGSDRHADHGRPTKVLKRKQSPESHGQGLEEIPYNATATIRGTRSQPQPRLKDEENNQHPITMMKVYEPESDHTQDPPSHSSLPSGSSGGAQSSFNRAASSPSSRHEPSPHTLHGDSLRLTAAMLRIARGPAQRQRRVSNSSFHGKNTPTEPDLLGIANALGMDALLFSFGDLLVYHPYLPPLETIVETERTDPEPGNTLLLAIILYLCALLLPSSPTVTSALDALVPSIYHLRDSLLLQASTSNSAAVALELLAQHAPFGTLPHQPHESPSFAVSRGPLLIGRHMTRTIVSDADPIRLGSLSAAFDSTETWLAASLYLSEAKEPLDVDKPVPRPIMDQIAQVYGRFLDSDQRFLWASSEFPADNSRLLGKLYWCECLARVAIMDDVKDELRRLLLSGGGQGSIHSVVEQCLRRLEEQADRVDEILFFIQADPRKVPSGWKSYREMLRLYDVATVWRHAWRYQLAISHRNLSPQGTGPETPEQAVIDALEFALRPSEVLRFFKSVNVTEGERQAVQQFVVARIESLAQSLVAFTSGGTTDSTTLSNPFRPLHQSVAIALDASDVYMEIQGAHMIISRDHDMTVLDRSFRVTQWQFLLDQVASMMKQMEGPGGKHTISSFCGDLVKTMSNISSLRRLAMARQKRNRNSGPSGPPAPTPGTTGMPGMPSVDGSTMQQQQQQQQRTQTWSNIPVFDDQSTNFTLDWLLQSQANPQLGGMDGNFGDFAMMADGGGAGVGGNGGGAGMDDPMLRLLFGNPNP